MKQLHKQLLAACLPYLLLIAVIWIVQLGFLEPAERARLRASAKLEVRTQALMIQETLARTISQLKLMAQSPGLRLGDANLIAAEVKRLSEEHGAQFVSLHHVSLGPNAPRWQPGAQWQALVNASVEAQLKQGSSVVLGFTVATGRVSPNVFLLVPVTDDNGSPEVALVGEVRLMDLYPLLDPQQNSNLAAYSLVDGFGHEISAATIQAGTPGARWTPQQAMSWSDTNRERVSAQIVPWNWQVIHSIDWLQALGALRFQRNMLSVLCIVAMVLTAVIVVWLNRKTNARLSKVIEAIQIFGAADPTMRIADDKPDEIGRLAETFNCMADDVIHAQRRLQKQLAEHQQTPGQWQERVVELEARLVELERYAAHLSHEFLGPLATLEGFASTLAAAARSGDWDLFDRDQARLKSICSRLRAISDALLRLAKRDPALPAESVSLSVAAKEAGELLLQQMEQLEISDQLPTVAGDAVLWRHVFANLLQNAIKACADTASPRIEIGCDERHGELVCFIRDNGRGMTLRELEQAFHGAGVGLGIVRRIVEHHGGKVWAESSGPGTGTTIVWTVT